jgi:hypothetical protein
MMSVSRDGIAKSLLKPINHSAVILLGGFSVLWGVWVGNPFWNVFSEADIFHVIANYGGEYAWGLVAVVMGLVTIYGVIHPSYRSLTRGAYVMFFQWLSVGLLFIAGNWEGLLGITCLFLAFYSGYIWLNMRVNRNRFDWDDRQADDVIRRESHREY